MAQATKRDEVWINALARAQKKGSAVWPVDLARDLGCSERMVKDCLLVMSGAGYLQRDVQTDGSVRYLPQDS